MAAKLQVIYVCTNCDAQFPKWSGRCLSCGGWGTLRKEAIDIKTAASREMDIPPAETVDLSSIAAELPRACVGLGEVDRVLGGGIMPGSLTLVSGEPGIGKSTLVAQIASAISVKEKVIYASGEESASQIKSRFERLKISQAKNLLLVNETNVERILASIKEKNPKLVIIDSIQSVYTAAIASEPGSLTQIRAAAVKFLEIAKQNTIAVILIGHITKDGLAAGPKSLEHIVDTVVYLESETAHDYRILRATKNRFGSTNEIGIFTMTGAGFEEVPNPSLIFIESGGEPIAGSSLSSVMEGTRPFLVEIQALVTKTVFGYPQRKAAGLDLNRLQILAAVLTKRTKINLANQDIILNIVGGLKISDPALDLAVCFAIASSLLNQPISRQTLVLGEVGLGGEIRRVNKLEPRLKEAAKLGFTKAIIPVQNLKSAPLKTIEVRSIALLVEILTN
ncbi:MAG: DNA repair protein RadA [Planctomycetes bacterium]|jgi:DNA repair protein RadA/Sms|nr:DNA repair protein RadA [Planctomycetota bacterium]